MFQLTYGWFPLTALNTRTVPALQDDGPVTSTRAVKTLQSSGYVQFVRSQQFGKGISVCLPLSNGSQRFRAQRRPLFLGIKFKRSPTSRLQVFEKPPEQTEVPSMGFAKST